MSEGQSDVLSSARRQEKVTRWLDKVKPGGLTLKKVAVPKTLVRENLITGVKCVASRHL